MIRRIALVVDDDRSIRVFMKTVLEREQFETLEAESGEGALEIVKGLGGSIDLIVTDIQMPNGDGLSLAFAVKKLFPSVPIVLVSGCAQPDAGFDFLEKPFTSATLATTVLRIIASKAA